MQVTQTQRNSLTDNADGGRSETIIRIFFENKCIVQTTTLFIKGLRRLRVVLLYSVIY